MQAGHGQLPISSRLLELRRQRGNRCLLLLEDEMRGESRLLELGYALGIAQGLDELQRVESRLPFVLGGLLGDEG